MKTPKQQFSTDVKVAIKHFHFFLFAQKPRGETQQYDSVF